jgi:Spy/CpxP family protein refolding chaperone
MSAPGLLFVQNFLTNDTESLATHPASKTKMKIMKKIILSVCIAALVATTMQAQEIRDREPGKHHMMKRHHRDEAFKNLNLTEDQKAQFKALNEDNRKQMAELKKNDSITVKEWNSKKEALRKDYREKMQSLLTTGQKSQLEKSKLERKAKMEGKIKSETR